LIFTLSCIVAVVELALSCRTGASISSRPTGIGFFQSTILS